jgi:predicted esterase
MRIEKHETSLNIPVSYVHLNKSENASSDKPLVLMFHGFADSAKSLLKRAFDEIPNDVEILAINGPFPIPQKKENKWLHAYAWYFLDFETREVHIHPNVGVSAVHNLLVHLGFENRPKIIIGYSQGGFFIPYLIKSLKNIKQIFSVGCYYRVEEYPSNQKIKIDALHGAQDNVVSFEQAEQTFAQLKQEKIIDGNFLGLTSMGHNFNGESRLWLKNNLARALKEI